MIAVCFLLLPESAARSYLVLAFMLTVTFLIFAAVNVLTYVFYHRTVPETRDRSMEAIESGFRTVTTRSR